jgi:sterol desaturase/sphingolipid hydroxylase (fatty acid hydroxylase superfamily)
LALGARSSVSLDFISLIFSKMFDIYVVFIPMLILLAVLFTLLSIVDSQASNPGKKWWRNPGLPTDISYALIHAVLGQYFRLPALIAIVFVLSGFMSKEAVNDYFEHGHGPLAGLPFWGQAAIYVIGSDFLLYWIHRIFHGATMWRFHAIHHSAKEVDWTTTYRFHPVNMMLQPALVSVFMISLGIKPEVMAYFIPFDILSAAFVHANVNWTLGPFKYVFASPVFHRWHHTMPEEGGNSNFAPTFSIFDWMFGTFYMPEGKLPEVFGNDDHHFPEGYFAQLQYPFKSLIANVRNPRDVEVPVSAAE